MREAYESHIIRPVTPWVCAEDRCGLASCKEYDREPGVLLRRGRIDMADPGLGDGLSYSVF